ncbi:MAG: DUF5674 family protein [Candidatus Omnitrophica bacterium]|nr:DUF5674 family protein [Candidatus Omnitrophota bacterium]
MGNLEFDSMINLRPSRENKTRGVDSKDIRIKIINIVNKWVKKIYLKKRLIGLWN